MEEPKEGAGDRLLKELLLPRVQPPQATVNFNASGATATIAVISAIAALAMYFQQSGQIAAQSGTIAIQATQVAELQRRVDRMQDYQQTEYMLIPQLKKLVDDEIKRQNDRSKR